VSIAAEAAPAPLDATALARALAALRIFFGLILFSNGLAKLFGFTQVFVGPYKATLIDRPEARGILDFEVNKRGGDGTDLPLLKSLVNNVMLDHWGIFQWLTTAIELGAGLALIIGLASRAAALVALGQQLFLQLVYFSSARFMWEQPHEWVPLVILALVPAGRAWGLDARLVHRGTRRFDHWPF
jgi:uncharacterized membrane protein YphA (DoxX/SURF4 family)